MIHPRAARNTITVSSSKYQPEGASQKPMCALTKDEVIAQLQKEVRILLHLASKIERSQLDYRPTPKQRSTIELLRYLVNMGCLLYTSDAADERSSVDLGGRR